MLNFSDDNYKYLSDLLKDDEEFAEYLFRYFPGIAWGTIDFLRSTIKNSDLDLFIKCFENISQNEYTKNDHCIPYEELLKETIPKANIIKKYNIQNTMEFLTYFKTIIQRSDNEKLKSKLYKRLDKWS